jgi:hypothetical protein
MEEFDIAFNEFIKHLGKDNYSRVLLEEVFKGLKNDSKINECLHLSRQERSSINQDNA